MTDDIASLLREQNRDYRELARQIADLSITSARHDEILKDRSAIITRNEKRHTKVETEVAELKRRTDAHGRKVEGLQTAFDAVMAAKKPIPQDWKTNPMVWSLIILGCITLAALAFAFGGDPNTVLNKIPQVGG